MGSATQFKLQTATKNPLTIPKCLDQCIESLFHVPICRCSSGNRSRSAVATVSDSASPGLKPGRPAASERDGKSGRSSARRASDFRGEIRMDAYYYVPGPSFLDIPENVVGDRHPVEVSLPRFRYEGSGPCNGGTAPADLATPAHWALV